MYNNFRVSGVPATIDNETLRRKVEQAYDVKINSVRIGEGSATLSTLLPNNDFQGSQGMAVSSVKQPAQASYVDISFEELERRLSS